MYLLLSIAHKKLGEFTQSVRILSRALQNFPRYYDAHIYRGKLLLKLKKYERAGEDFDAAIELAPEKALAYVGKGDCLRL